MREIKFRGFVIEPLASGEKWISSDEEYHEVYINRAEETAYINGHEVVYESVSEYTGLKDKNGKEIFEGDILHRVCTDWDIDETYQVVWGGVDYPAFDVRPHYDGDCNFFTDYGFDDEFGELEIIGNIYENPELLEESK